MKARRESDENDPRQTRASRKPTPAEAANIHRSLTAIFGTRKRGRALGRGMKQAIEEAKR